MKYALLLNDMRSPNIENIKVVKVSNNKQELIDWYNSQLTTPYGDGRWGKSFKKESELEWFNPAHELEKRENDYWGGIWTFGENIPDENILQFSICK